MSSNSTVLPPLRLFIVRRMHQPDVIVYAHAVSLDVGVLLFATLKVTSTTDGEVMSATYRQAFREWSDYEEEDVPEPRHGTIN